MDINRLTAVVTGGGSGLGAETAKQLSQAGAHVVLLDTDLQKAQTLAKEINGFAIQCDISDATSTQAAFDHIQNQFGAIRACINCAGIAPAKRIVGREAPMPLADFRHVIDVNLIGTFNIMRLAATSMSQATPLNANNERGIIINTASIAAYDGQIGQAAYSASKGGIVAMTLPAARELAPFGIRVMAIAPGIMQTPMTSNMPQQIQDNLSAAIPFPKRFGLASEYAKLVLHIIENTYLNGEVIRLDGAVRMQGK